MAWLNYNHHEQDFDHVADSLTVSIADATEAADEYMSACKLLGNSNDMIYGGKFCVMSFNGKRDVATPFMCGKMPSPDNHA